MTRAAAGCWLCPPAGFWWLFAAAALLLLALAGLPPHRALADRPRQRQLGDFGCRERGPLAKYAETFVGCRIVGVFCSAPVGRGPETCPKPAASIENILRNLLVASL